MDGQQLNLNYKDPILAIDGNAIAITEQGPVNLVFWQARQQTPETINADVVSAVRFHTLEEFKAFHKTIGDTIKKHETREK